MCIFFHLKVTLTHNSMPLSLSGRLICCHVFEFEFLHIKQTNKSEEFQPVKYRESHCLFSCSTDLRSSSSRALTAFTIVAWKSSAPLRHREIKSVKVRRSSHTGVFDNRNTVSRWQSVTVCSTQQTVTFNCNGGGGGRRSFDLLLKQRCHDWDTSAELYWTSEVNFNTIRNLSQYHHNEQIQTIFHCLHNECMISYIFPTCYCCLPSVFILRFESKTFIFNEMRLF